MKQDIIELFMWGYQKHFRVRIHVQMEMALEALGLKDTTVDCFLVGVRDPKSTDVHDVCVEPEDGKWGLDLFPALVSRVEAAVRTHPSRDLEYTDEQSQQEHPEHLWRDAVRQEVQNALSVYDAANNVTSFCGRALPVSRHYVVPVFQVPNGIFVQFPQLREVVTQWSFTPPPSLIHATVHEVLKEAYVELDRAQPGKHMGHPVSSGEITRRAAELFLYAPGKAIGDDRFLMTNLFDRLNAVSSWMYEGTASRGKMVLAVSSSDEISVQLRFAQTVPFSEPRWARKILEMAPAGTSLLADTQGVYGLGKLSEEADSWSSQDVFEVDFVGHYHWRLRCGEKVLLSSKYGVPSLPVPRFPIHHLTETHERLFPESKPGVRSRLSKLYDVAVSQPHGSMLVVAQDAASEAKRLERQGIQIESTRMTQKLYRQVSRIDGCVLVDPNLVCHAVGVILDGAAHVNCTPSRGARYNSGLRYVLGSKARRLAVVISDDKTVDVIPGYRRRIQRSEVENAVAALETADKDDYHQPVRWLSRHRFYLSAEQCLRVNAAVARIEKEAQKAGEAWFDYGRFEADPEMDDSYFKS